MQSLKKLFAAISATILFSCGPTPAPAQTVEQLMKQDEIYSTCVDTTTVLVRLQPYLIDPVILKNSIEAVEQTTDSPEEVKSWFKNQLNLGAYMQNPKIYGKLVFNSCVNEMKGKRNEL